MDEFDKYAEQVRWMRLPWIYRIVRNYVVFVWTLMGWTGIPLMPLMLLGFLGLSIVSIFDGTLKERASVRIQDWQDPGWE